MSLKNLKLSVKIPLILVTLAALNAAVLSSLAIHKSKNAVIEVTEQKLAAVRYGVENQLRVYLHAIAEDLSINSKSPNILAALNDFNLGWDALTGVNQTLYLQDKYITNNPNEAGKKHLLDAASDGSVYSEKHRIYHPFLRDILEEHEYYDIFLVNPKGDIVFTVFKELDFATNLVNGQWKDTGLAALFKQIKDKPVKGEIVFNDFKPYAPSNNVPAAFIGTAIFDEAGQFAGALIYQMPIGRINNMTQVAKEVSESAEVHIVGEDFLLRNDPNLEDKEDPILKQKMDTEPVRLGLDNKKGISVSEDEGMVTFASYTPFDAYGSKWVLFVDIFEAEVMKEANALEKLIVMVSLGVLVIMGFITFLYARTLTGPINSLTTSMVGLANRDYATIIPFQNRGDEMGDMARSVEIFKQNGIAVQKLEAEQAALKIKAEEDKKEAMNMLANDFDSRTSGIIKSLAAAATEMQATAAQMTSASTNTAHASQIVASAATEADSNVQTVAAATEELSASSSEIARQISSVAEKSTRASSEAVKTSQQVGELNGLADSIGEVIGAIKDIAEQTNLLALNATIEAARAGEAGKGFAVVADEVKKLATETASKTIQIDERVGKIQAAIRATVEAVGRIINDVNDIDHSTSTVASAVEEQNAATAEIGRNVSEASSGTQQVAQNIVDVQRSAEETGEAANNLNQAANELAEIAENLQEQVSDFLSEIRSS